ncbi:PREDICTED: uncharacterized protein LOC108791590 [Nanorana parkeri]|uniref:uncharacterized protein LOC108791590 n=1 Tax=Nanorana parkeri TaxID=125878 RepID=UPI000854F285|nr:PREDICTED: uncharacterized protein LOC108791590 [Nanorana parkeri]
MALGVLWEMESTTSGMEKVALPPVRTHAHQYLQWYPTAQSTLQTHALVGHIADMVKVVVDPTAQGMSPDTHDPIGHMLHKMIPVIGLVLLILPCILSRERFITSYGGICTSPCGLHGESYYWCWQKGYSKSSWDYCSPAEKYDYKYNPCQSSCKSDGKSYTWCSVSQGSWGYCGRITEQFETWYTRYDVQCVTDCNKHGDYFRCLDSNDNREYCSPSNHVTRKGKPCRENHPCGSYGKSYLWCYTDENNNWDYCGKKIIDCEKSVYFSHRKKRAREEHEVCRIENTAHRRVILLRAIPETRFLSPTRNQYMDASQVIDMLTPNTVFRRGTLLTHNTVRLDMQGEFVSEGVRYYNLQVQLNGQRQGQSSFSQALIPVDMDVSIFLDSIQTALHTSLDRVYHGDPVKVFAFIQRM